MSGDISADPICEICAEINFNILRTPTLTDVADLCKGKIDVEKRPFTVVKGSENQRPFPLGNLKDIIKRSQKCRLCYLVWHIISSSGGYTSEGTLTTGEGISVEARAEQWGIIRHPEAKVPTRNNKTWLYHLGIRTLLTTNMSPREYFGHAFQFHDIVANSEGVGAAVSWLGSNLAYNGRLRPLCIDIGLLRRWLSICDSNHGSACQEVVDQSQKIGIVAGLDEIPHNEFSLKKIALIRFIDVSKRSIKVFTNISLRDVRYFALSYVWGFDQKLKLTSTNISHLIHDGSLDSIRPAQTITDTLVLAEKLSVPYLWVDALCILQDSVDDKKDQIAIMADVYRAAYVTVVAASGKDANAGLPGLWPGTRSAIQNQVVIRRQGCEDNSQKTKPTLISLLTVLKPKHLNVFYEKTTWVERGWTLQERAMSPRVLVFTDDQVYWQCTTAMFCEEINLEVPDIPLICALSRMDITLQRNWAYVEEDSHGGLSEKSMASLILWTKYQELVGSYSERQFSFNGDVHDGFAAIIKGFEEKSGDQFLWGLPSSRLELGLSWFSIYGSTRRIELSTLPMTSLNKRIQFPSWSWMAWIGEIALSIRDDRYDVGEIPEVVCYLQQNNPFVLVKAADIAQDVKYPAPYFTERPTALTSKWKIVSSPTVTTSDLETQLPHLSRDVLAGYPDNYLLFFWTSVASFKVINDKEQILWSEMKTHNPKIVDLDGNIVGITSSLPLDAQVNGRSEAEIYEFVVIGRRQILYFKPELIVLQVHSSDGVMYRMNTADIDEEAWVRAEPEWKLVVLG